MAVMSLSKSTVKKVLEISVLPYTLAPMVRTYINAGVKTESVMECVRWAAAHPGAFYIYENFLKNINFKT